MNPPSRDPEAARNSETPAANAVVPAPAGLGDGPGTLSGDNEFPDLRSLVTRLQEGDSKAMEELYAMLSNGVRYHLCRQLGPEELDDRLHDAFLIVVDSIRAGELRDPRGLMGFVRTIVKRMIAATIATKISARREHLDEQKSSNVSDKGVTPEDALRFRQQTNIVREVLREMPERDRQILTRFYVDEQSPQAICEDMSLTLTQFRLFKSRAKYRFGELGKKKLQQTDADGARGNCAVREGDDARTAKGRNRQGPVRRPL